MTNTAHHHNCCIHNGHIYDVDARLSQASEHFATAGVRFTPLRQAVYRLILASDKPVGAYDLISALQADRQHDSDNKRINVAPPTVYRTLEFLLAHGLIHQLNSINAYIPCCHPRAEHAAAFLICETCQHVQECSNPPVNELIAFSQVSAQFQVTHSIIELRGLCHDCQPA